MIAEAEGVVESALGVTTVVMCWPGHVIEKARGSLTMMITLCAVRYFMALPGVFAHVKSHVPSPRRCASSGGNRETDQGEAIDRPSRSSVGGIAET